MFKTEADWIKAYEQKDGLWIHDGNPLRPHALLTSGNHSNGFFNSRKIIPDDELLQEAALNLVERLTHYVDHPGLRSIGMVVGPQTGATRLAELMAESLTIEIGKKVGHSSPAKFEVGGMKTMLVPLEDMTLLRGATVLLCEDVVSTGGSIMLTEQAVRDAGGNPLPFVCTLVNRSGERFVNGILVVALINKALPMWAPEECPLCPLGSEAIPAKDPVNWARLTAAY